MKYDPDKYPHPWWSWRAWNPRWCHDGWRLSEYLLAAAVAMWLVGPVGIFLVLG